MTLPTDEEISGIAFRVSGRVQGVSFRWFGRKAAEELGVRGWIRNRADGSVEGEAFGPATAVESFMDQLRQGPRAAVVEDLEWKRTRPGKAPSRFKIRS